MVAGSRIAIVLAVIISGVASTSSDSRTGCYLEFFENKFTKSGAPQLQCANSVFCPVAEAQVTHAICSNENKQTRSWDCVFTLRGSGYAVSAFSVECPGSISSDPCVLENSCYIRYSVRQASQPVAVFSGVGGGLSFLIFCFVVYWCCCRKKKAEPRVVNIIRPELRRRPSTPPPASAVNQTNVTVQVAAPAAPNPAPAAVYYAPPMPAFAAPAQPMPAYAAPAQPMPAYAAPPPPFNPNYAANAPTFSG